MLPQIALGHSQSAILNTAVFENEVLHLTQIMIPPLMSSTLSSEDVLDIKSQDNTSKNQNNTEGTTSAGGRPEKSDDEKAIRLSLMKNLRNKRRIWNAHKCKT